jgi:phage N-6-adenine-methyltransferase
MSVTVSVCMSCGGQFTGRRQKRTCSSPCRQRLYRRRQSAKSRSARLAVRHGLSSRDFWGTNPQDFAQLDAVFRFGLDAAAVADDALVVAFISPDDDAFSMQWGPLCLPGRLAVFLNPPYSAAGRTPRGRGLLAWLKLAYEQSQRWGLIVVCIVPHDPSTQAGQFAHQHAPVIGVWPTRRRFLHPDSRRPMSGNNHGSCAVVFRPAESGPARYIYLDRLALDHPEREQTIALLRGPQVSTRQTNVNTSLLFQPDTAVWPGRGRNNRPNQGALSAPQEAQFQHLSAPPRQTSAAASKLRQAAGSPSCPGVNVAPLFNTGQDDTSQDGGHAQDGKTLERTCAG